MVSCSHAVALSRDVERLEDIKKRVNVMPLGRLYTQLYISKIIILCLLRMDVLDYKDSNIFEIL